LDSLRKAHSSCASPCSSGQSFLKTVGHGSFLAVSKLAAIATLARTHLAVNKFRDALLDVS